MSERSLGKGVLSTTEEALYTVPNNSSCRTTLLTFVNTGSTTVALTVSKKVGNISYGISPKEMIFPASYLCQEDGAITLSANDSIVAYADTADVVTYLINGVEEIIPKT